MKTKMAQIVMDVGDSLELVMPNGQAITVGYGWGGQVPANKPHVFVGTPTGRAGACQAYEVNGLDLNPYTMD